MEYHHKQSGTVIIACIVLVLAFLVVRAMMHRDSIFIGEIIVLVIIAGVLSLFSSLTVEIKNNTLSCWFSFGIIRKSFLLPEINDAAAVRNFWLSGWGIRWMPGRYWLWNVSGLDAVELSLKNGRRFRIGTDEPEALVRAIKNNKEHITP